MPADNEETKETQTPDLVARVITPDTQIEFQETEQEDKGLAFLKFNSEFVARDLISDVQFAGYKQQLETLDEVLSIKIRD